MNQALLVVGAAPRGRIGAANVSVFKPNGRARKHRNQKPVESPALRETGHRAEPFRFVGGLQ